MKYCLVRLGVGLLQAQPVSIQIAESGESTGMSRRADELKMRNMTLRQLIQYSYSLHKEQIVAGPDWAAETKFDVAATVSGETRPELRRILAEHFRVQLHEDKREMPSYALAVAGGGHKLRKPADGSRTGMEVNQANGGGTIKARRVPMKRLTDLLIEALDRPILDGTGLEGEFDFDMGWQNGIPGLIGALESSLGLKLEARNDAVTAYRIVRAERP